MMTPWMLQFARPEFLWLFLPLGLLGVWAWVGSRRRLRDWKRLGQGGQPSRSGTLVWLLVMVCLIVALARPRWGRDPDAGLEPGHDVVLVVDVSRSMAVEDAWPDRLGVALRSAESLIQTLGREPGNRVGIVAFAGRAVIRCPLTANLGAVNEILSDLQPGSIEPGGSQVASALEASLRLLEGERPGPEPGRFVVVFSDGEFHESAWDTVVPRLQTLRIPVHALAIGDPDQGHPVPVPTTSGSSRPLTYRGEIVLSRRSDDALRLISQATGGAFLPVGMKPVDLGRLYRERIEPEARRQRELGSLDERSDRFPIFLAASFALSIVALWPRFRKPALVVGLIAIGLVAASSSSGPVSEAIQRGQAAYDRGDFNAALAEFERAVALRPDHPLPRYNAGAALYQLQRFAEAESRYREASQSADELLQRQIDYALGNLAFVRGDYRGAVSHYDRCLANATDAHESQSLRADALQNRAEAVRRIPPEADEPEPPDPEGREPDAPEKPERTPDHMAEPSDSPTSPGSGGVSPTPEQLSDGRPPGDSVGSEAEATESESPDDRLARAIANIEQAKQRRPARPDQYMIDETRKDW